MRSRPVVLVLALLIFVAVFFSLGGMWVQFQIQKRIHLELRGNFAPVFFRPSFYLRNAHVEWKRKVELESGTLKVEYNPVSLLTGKYLRVKLSGENLPIQFLGEWAQMQGIQKVTLKNFDADLELDASGIREIFYLNAESPGFQFHIKKSENNKEVLDSPP